jgi:excisionase family DNA binding protein
MNATTQPECAEIVPLWLSYRQAQRLTGLGRTKLWTLVSTGQIRAAKIGKTVKISRQSLEQFMEHHATQPRLPGFDNFE